MLLLFQKRYAYLARSTAGALAPAHCYCHLFSRRKLGTEDIYIVHESQKQAIHECVPKNVRPQMVLYKACQEREIHMIHHKHYFPICIVSTNFLVVSVFCSAAMHPVIKDTAKTNVNRIDICFSIKSFLSLNFFAHIIGVFHCLRRSYLTRSINTVADNYAFFNCTFNTIGIASETRKSCVGR